MGLITGSYLDFIDDSPGYLVIDNLDLYASQSAYIAEDLYVSGTIYGTAATASYLNDLTQSVNILGNLTVNGAITASVLNVLLITSSISVITGSTVFGSSSIDTHEFTGSIITTGSVYVTGSIYSTGEVYATSSYATSASYVVSSSYAETASYALNAVGFTTTGSFTGSFTGSIRSQEIIIENLANTLSRTENYITGSSVLNSSVGLIWASTNPTTPSVFINYYASDLGSGGSFMRAGTIIICTDGLTTSLIDTGTPILGSGALVFTSNLGSSLELYAGVSGMNTQCDFVLDVKTLY